MGSAASCPCCRPPRASEHRGAICRRTGPLDLVAGTRAGPFDPPVTDPGAERAPPVGDLPPQPQRLHLDGDAFPPVQRTVIGHGGDPRVG